MLQRQGFSGDFFRNQNAGKYHFSSMLQPSIPNTCRSQNQCFLSTLLIPLPPTLLTCRPIHSADYLGRDSSKAVPAGTCGRNLYCSQRILKLGRREDNQIHQYADSVSIPTFQLAVQGSKSCSPKSPLHPQTGLNSRSTTLPSALTASEADHHSQLG